MLIREVTIPILAEESSKVTHEDGDRTSCLCVFVPLPHLVLLGRVSAFPILIGYASQKEKVKTIVYLFSDKQYISKLVP